MKDNKGFLKREFARIRGEVMFRYLALLLLLSACAALPANYMELETSARLPHEELLRKIEDKRVIFAGEVHTDRVSHKVQLEVIKHLYNSGKKITIAIEIFQSSEQAVVDGWLRGSMSDREFRNQFRTMVNLPFAAYEEILEFAKRNRIPVRGIDTERRLIAEVSRNGIDTVPGDYLREIKYSDCSGETEYAEALGFYNDRQYHQAGMPFFCDGQRLRDTIMAYNIANILKERDTTVVALIGIMHASKIAVPGLLQKHGNVPYVVIMPADIQDLIKRTPDTAIADYIWE